VLKEEDLFIYDESYSFIIHDINLSNHDWVQREQQGLAPLVRPVYHVNGQNATNDRRSCQVQYILAPPALRDSHVRAHKRKVVKIDILNG